MAQIQDGHHFKARRNSSRPISQEPAIGSARDRMQIEGRAEGRILPIFKMAEIQDGHHFKARRISSRPISQEPAIGSARDRMQIEGRAEGEFHQFSKWPKSKMATTLRLAEIPVGRFRRNQRSDRLGPDANRRSSRGGISPIFKMAEIQDGHHFKARRNSSRPISQEPAIGSARDRMQIEGRAEGEFYQFSKRPKSKMATTLRLAEIPVGRFCRNQRSDRLGTGCKSKVEPRENFTNFQNGRNPRWPPL